MCVAPKLKPELPSIVALDLMAEQYCILALEPTQRPAQELCSGPRIEVK